MAARGSFWVLAIAAAVCLQAAAGQGVVGEGSSAAAPLYTAMIAGLQKATPAAKVSYTATGSGAGVKSFVAGTADFAGTDAHPAAADLAAAKAGALVVPSAGVGIGIPYNLAAVPGLKLSRKALAGIFSGAVKTWNDPLIAASNPTAKLPATPITVVVRSDSSGSTNILTSHLAAIDAKSFKASSLPDWAGLGKTAVKAKGSSGVAEAITATPGSIGYLEISNKLAAKLTPASIENKKGAFVAPTVAGVNAALATAFPATGYAVSAADPEGATAYPISGVTFLLLAKSYPAAKAGAKDFATYALSPAGQAAGAALSYASIPTAVLARASKDVAAIKTA
jgi:phosphate transport system substrate-binding protein